MTYPLRMRNHEAAVEDAQTRHFGLSNTLAMLGHEPVIVTTRYSRSLFPIEETHVTEDVYSLKAWRASGKPFATINKSHLRHINDNRQTTGSTKGQPIRFPRNLSDFGWMLKIWQRKGGKTL